jgi:lantibiotic modifying enzyme
VADTKRSNGWRPLLEESGRQHAVATVDRLARELPRDTAAEADGSLSGGAAGVSLFFAYRSGSVGDDTDGDTALGLAERALQGAAARPRDPVLHGGYLGIGWTLAHLERLFVDIGDEDPNDALDQALLALLAAPWAGDYDLISGLVGVGVYALERFPRPSARLVLDGVVERLAEIAEADDTGVAWWKPPEALPPWRRAEDPAGHYDLGVAHGVPGVIALLAHALAHGVETARPLLEGAVSWLLAERLPPGAGSAFPVSSGPGVKKRPARLAWCYGDVGVAAALLAAARAASDPDWEGEALAIALGTLERPADESGVIDAGLCHGAAGLGHVYNRLYQLTEEERLRDAACFWFEHALELERPAASGFLEGAAGVGLALLAAATDVEPAWDAVLLLSSPPA